MPTDTAHHRHQFNVILSADVGIPYDDEIFSRKLNFDDAQIVNDVDEVSIGASSCSSTQDQDIFGPRPARVQRVSSGHERLVLFPNDLDDILLNNNALEGIASQDAGRGFPDKVYER